MTTYQTAPLARRAPLSGSSDRGPSASRYLALLNIVFAVCNSARVIAYLPTMWAIHVSADSGQHSLLTWLVFGSANLTMGLWLYEKGGRKPNCAVAVNLCNAFMCVCICVLIFAYRR